MRYSPSRIHNPLPGDIIIMEMMIYLPSLVVLIFFLSLIASTVGSRGGAIGSVGGEVFEADAYLARSSGCTIPSKVWCLDMYDLHM